MRWFLRVAVAFFVLAPAAVAAQTPAPPCAIAALKPIAATHTIPPYPTISEHTGEEGTVTMRVTITPDGSVSQTMVEKSSGSLRLDDAATQYVQENWRWQPFDKDCVPVIQTIVAIKWDLRDAPQGATPYVLIDLDPADYPPDARAKQERGISTVAIQLSETGAIVNARIVSGSNFADLDNKAVEIARTRWQWTPAQMAGKPVSSIVFVSLRWRPEVGAAQAAPKP